MWKQLSNEEAKNVIISHLSNGKSAEDLYAVDMHSMSVIEVGAIEIEDIYDYLKDEKDTVFILFLEEK